MHFPCREDGEEEKKEVLPQGMTENSSFRNFSEPEEQKQREHDLTSAALLGEVTTRSSP